MIKRNRSHRVDAEAASFDAFPSNTITESEDRRGAKARLKKELLGDDPESKIEEMIAILEKFNYVVVKLSDQPPLDNLKPHHFEIIKEYYSTRMSQAILRHRLLGRLKLDTLQ